MDVKSLFKEDSFYLIVGIKRRGKSTLTKYLLYHQIMAGLIDWVVVFSGTAEVSDEWKFVNNKLIFSKFDESTIEYFLEQQTLINKNRPKDQRIHLAMVFDDIAGVIPTGSPIYTKLATTCRHYNMSVFFLTQAMNESRGIGCPRPCRMNAEYTIVFHTDDESTVESIYREKIGMAFKGRYQDFKEEFRDKVQDKVALIVDGTSDNNKVKRYYYFKAQPVDFVYTPRVQVS